MGRPAVPIEERFWSKVSKTGACWLWTAGKTKTGYGVFGIGVRTRNARAHRVAYELLVGPIPEGMTLDHLCLVKACVNPAHLEVVTASENSIRANRNKPNCRKGHPYAEHGFTVDGQGKRYCSTCRATTRQERSERDKRIRLENPKPRVLRSHCSKGHEYTEANTYWTPSTGKRACRACKNNYGAKK